MAETTYAFLDLTGLAALRSRVLATEAAIVFDETLSHALWANAAGAQLFGGDGFAMLAASRLNSGQPFVRQLRDAARQIADDGPIVRGFRIVKGLRTEFIQCELARLALPDGARAILLTCADEAMFRRKREHDLAEDAVAVLEGVAQAAAIIDEYGLPIAASDSFAGIDIAAGDLEAAIAAMPGAAEAVARLRAVAEDGLTYALGLARLRTHPGRYLLLVDRVPQQEADAGGEAAAIPAGTLLPVFGEQAAKEPQYAPEPEHAAEAEHSGHDESGHDEQASEPAAAMEETAEIRAEEPAGDLAAPDKGPEEQVGEEVGEEVAETGAPAEPAQGLDARSDAPEQADAPQAPAASRRHGSIRALLESWYLRETPATRPAGETAGGQAEEPLGEDRPEQAGPQAPASMDRESDAASGEDVPSDDQIPAGEAIADEASGEAEIASREIAPQETGAGETAKTEAERETGCGEAQGDEAADEDFAEDFDARAAIEGGKEWHAAPGLAGGEASPPAADGPGNEIGEDEQQAEADEAIAAPLVGAADAPHAGPDADSAAPVEADAAGSGGADDLPQTEPATGRQSAGEEQANAGEPERQPDHSHDFVFVSSDHPVRFAWTVDEAQIFRSVSPDLGKALGPNAADVVGRRWSDVARVFGFDRGGDIQRLLEKRDTWSGKTVLWPVQGTDLAVPVDLAALPAFSGSRTFDGFRGFGIIRTADAIVDPDETGLALVSVPMGDIDQGGGRQGDEAELGAAAERRVMAGTPFQEAGTAEEPGGAWRALSGEPGAGGNVVELTRRKRDRQDELSNREVRAFQEIGRKLGTDEIAAAFAGRRTPDTEGADRGFDAGVPEDGGEEMVWRDDAVLAQRETRDAQEVRREADIGPIANAAGETTASILKRLPIPVLVYRSGETLYANPELLAISGYDSVEELARAGGIDALFSASGIYEGENATMVLKRREGGGVSVSPLLQSVPWEGEKALLLTFRLPQPVAEPVDDKVALDQARIVELNNILDTATDGIVIASNDGIVESLNGPAQALFGRGADEMTGRALTDLFAPESHRGINEYMREVSEPGIVGLLNDGREAIGLEAKGGLIPLFITLGRTGSGKFCAVLRDITQWKKAEEDLVSARRMAETASEQKSEFLARVSHEIRTPLNAIIGFSDVMIEERFGPIGNDRYRGYLRDINRSGIHVLDLINDLLDISKIEAGKMELTYEAVDLNQLVTETVALLQPQANGERIIIRTSLSRAVPRVVADARSIRQIVLNLVSNAIKFTPANGQVIVSTVYEGNGEVVLRVRDTGMGMSEREIEHAMKPFHQVHVTQDKRGQGTGLGLPLTKALVEANRAYFDLESTPGEGTIAHVHFPTQRVLAD